MSTITITYNISDQKWNAELNAVNSAYCTLQLAFTSNNANTIFDNLSFEYQFKHLGIVLQEGKFPEENVVFRNSSEKVLAAIQLKLLPEKTYEISMNVQNGNQKSSFAYNFSSSPNTDNGNYTNSSVVPPSNVDLTAYRFDGIGRQWILK